MKLRKIDGLLAECRPLTEDNCKKLGTQYFEIDCPFCGRKNAVFYRNFWKGTRCKNKDCRAMFNRCFKEAMRDMVPGEMAKKEGK